MLPRTRGGLPRVGCGAAPRREKLIPAASACPPERRSVRQQELQAVHAQRNMRLLLAGDMAFTNGGLLGRLTATETGLNG